MINLAIALALVATPGLQNATTTTVDAAASVQQSVRTSTADPAQRICVRADTTGSRVSRLVCKTRLEWERAGGVPGNND